MTALVVDCGAAQTLAALVVGDDVSRFFFLPAIDDGIADAGAEAGDLFLGRVKTVAGAVDGAFIDIGMARDAFLPRKGAHKPPVEGASIIVRVKRPALDEKGAVVTTDWTVGLAQGEQQAIRSGADGINPPQRLGSPLPPVVRLTQSLGRRLHRIVINDRRAAADLKTHAPDIPVELNADPFADYDIAALIEESLEQTTPLPGGARLIFAETEGGCVIDVDASVAAASASQRVNDKVNAIAAQAIFREIERRAIGGRIIVDFLPPTSEKSFAALFKELNQRMRSISGARAGKLRKDGVFDFTAPKTQASLLTIASESAGDDWLRPGRCLTADWRLKSAIYRLETILRRSPRARPSLRLGRDLFAHLQSNDVWLARLSERHGARFLIEASDRLQPRDYDLAE